MRGRFLFLRAALPGMVAQRAGRVVNSSSGAAVGASRGYSGYGVSKTALNRLTEEVAAELRFVGVSGVSCFTVGPGTVSSRLSDSLLADAAPRVRERGTGLVLAPQQRRDTRLLGQRELAGLRRRWLVRALRQAGGWLHAAPLERRQPGIRQRHR